MSDTPIDNSGQPPQDPKDLRTQLEAANQDRRQKDTTIRDLQVQNALLSGGLSLNETQVAALNASLGDQEVNKDNVLSTAKNLGWEPAPASSTTSDSTSNTPPAPEPNTPDDPVVKLSMAGLNDLEIANVMANRDNKPSGAFDQAMAEAKSKDEVIAAVKQHGRSVGLVLESDLD